MRKDMRAEDGMVTAEAAMVLPSLVLVLLLAVTVVLTVGAKLKCVDAAREAARVAARGDSDARALEAAHRLGPASSQVQLRHRGKWVQVTVGADVHPLGILPALHVSASALTLTETP